MCCVMGYTGHDLSAEKFKEYLLRTVDRGPDDQRVVEGPYGLMGFGRLAIMDEGCQVVRPRGVRSRIASRRSQMACRVIWGSAPCIAATIAGRRSSPTRRAARPRTSSGRKPSRT